MNEALLKRLCASMVTTDRAGAGIHASDLRSLDQLQVEHFGGVLLVLH
jgi:hypothetical protein